MRGNLLVALVIAAVLVSGLPMAMVSNAAGASSSLSAIGVGADPGNDPAVSSRFVNAVIGEPQSLDPAWDFETSGAEILQNVYETLVAFNGSSAIDLIPRLATEVPTVANGGISADGINYTFHLRTDVKFHDDTIMDADDVIYSIKRCLMINDLEGPSSLLAPLLYPDWPGNGFLLDEATVNASMTEVNSTTVVFHLIAPAPYFVYIMTCTCASIVSKEYVELNGGTTPLTRNDWMNTHECGSGPYTLNSWTHWTEIVLSSFSGYWRTPAAIEEVDLIQVADVGTREMMLLDGEASSIYLPRANIPDIEGSPGIRIVSGLPTLEIDFFGMNEQIVPHLDIGNVTANFFSDVHIRQAFVHSFNYTKYLHDVLLNTAIQPNGPIPQGMLGYDPAIPNYTMDLAYAAAQLKLAMNPNVPGKSYAQTGFSVVLYYNEGNTARQAGCQLLKDGLEALSQNHALGVNGTIHVSVNVLDWPTYLDARTNKWLPVFFMGWLVDYPDPNDFAVPFCDRYGSFPFMLGIVNDTLSNLVHQAAFELNETLRVQLYAEITQSCYDNAYYLWTTQPMMSHVERTWVQGYYYNPTFAGLYYYDLGLDVSVPSDPTWSRVSGGYDHIDLSWNEPAVLGSAPITSYILYRGTAADDLYFLTYTGMGYIDFNVSVGQTYYYAVRAVTSVGDGALSDSQSASVQDVAPSSPTIGAATPEATSVTVHWTAPTPNGGSPLTGYTVFYGTSPLPSVDHVFADPTATSVAVTGLMPNTPYYFNVVAMNGYGNSNASDDVSVTTLDLVPNAPTIGSATPGLNDVTVTWTPPSPNGGTAITIYRVYYGVSSNPATAFVTAAAADNSKVVGGLAAGTRYYFNVVAVNAAGPSMHSNDASATTTNLAPNPPTIGTATPYIGSVLVTWIAPAPNGGSPLTGYSVFYGTSPHPSVNSMFAEPTATNASLTGLTANILYYFNVVAMNAFGDSPASDDASATIIDIAPNAPIIGPATAGLHNVTITWTAPATNGGTALTGYRVYFGLGPNPNTTFVPTGPENMSLLVTDLSPVTNYFFNVVAINAAGDSPRSEDVSVTTLDIIPNSPSIATTIQGLDWINLTWTAPPSNGGSPITGYVVYYGLTAYPSTLNVTAEPGVRSANVTGLEPRTTYFINLVAVNAAGSSMPSPDISVATLDIAPNPPTIGIATPHYKEVTVSWAAPLSNGGSPLTGYLVYYGTIAHPSSVFLTVWSANTSATVGGLDSGKLYYFNVVAVNAAGNSTPSEDASAETLRTNSPSGLMATAGDSIIVLNWTAPSDAMEHPILTYRIVRSEMPGESKATITVSGGVIHYIDHNLTLGRNYTYELTAVTSVGDSLSITAGPVQALAASRISLEVTTIALTDSFQVTIAANLTKGDGTPIGGAKLMFSYSRNGLAWTVLATKNASADGRTSVTWSPTELNGTYYLNVEYSGNQTISGSSNSDSVNLVSVSGKYVLSVSSSSTVSGFAFNATKNELTFSVSGEAGTTGHARIVLPSGLIADSTKITVKVDGLTKSYVIVPVTGGWALDIAYNHSTHSVIVGLGELPSENAIDFTLVIAVCLVAVVVVVVAILLMVRKKKS